MKDHTSDIKNNTFLVTGSAGFIGYHVAPGLDVYEIINLGNHRAEELQRVIGILESELKLKAEQNLLPIQPGD
ncbi:MAG: hypothetical protein KJ822_08370, partial [Proteobacteria bacterium]|nr:hypothetical protein [Pseudomonadota bacterium]